MAVKKKFDPKKLLIVPVVLIAAALLVMLIQNRPVGGEKLKQLNSRQADLNRVKQEKGLRLSQAEMERVLDSVYISDMQSLISWTVRHRSRFGDDPWEGEFKARKLREVENVDGLKLMRGINEPALDTMKERDIYVSDQEGQVAFCASMLQRKDKEKYPGDWCESETGCACEVLSDED